MKALPLPLLLVSAALAGLPTLAHAVILGPYVPDSNTVHLWHLDESSGAVQAVNAVVGQNNLIAVDGGSPLSDPAPTSTVILGATGAASFGNAANISATDLGLGYDGNGNLQFNPDITAPGPGADGISSGTLVGSNGAFTLEALVNLSSITGSQRELISLESSNGTVTQRPFQFVISSTGTLRFRDFSNNLTLELAIPTAGADGFTAGAWFHAAYAYDGEGTGSFYWTLLDDSRTQASLLGTVSAPDILARDGSLVIGNENRGAFGEGLLGLIDEVRISNVGRGAEDFMFAVPEPSAFALVLGSLTWLGLRRRRRSDA